MNQQKLKIPVEIEEQKVEKYKGYELKTKNGYRLDEVVSALQKEIRLGNELMAKYWALEMNDSGYWRYCFRRMMVVAGEDCGLANPEAMILVSSTFSALLAQERVKKVFHIDNNIIGFIAIYLARSPKSRHCDYLGGLILKQKERGWKPEIPIYAIDVHTQRGKDLGKSDYDFFKVGSLIKNKKHISGEDTVKRECLSLYGFTERRDESQF